MAINNVWSTTTDVRLHRAGFHKKPTKQDGTHMTIRSQISIPTSIFPTTHTTISPAYIPPIFNHTHYTTHSNYTTRSPSQLHLLYTQNSLNTHHKLLVHIPASSINATAWSHSTPQTLTLQANKSSTTTSTCTIVVGT